MRLTPIKKTFTYGARQVTLETGEMARQAHGSVVVNVDDTAVLCTVVGARQAKSGQDFLPLTCDYVEKTYAAGKIPGGFFKREGSPSEKETLTSRLIDRPIRPLFPDGFYNEVQVVAQVLSCNPEVDPDIPALIGVSAALTISGIPFNGPIGAARVGRINGEYVLNPTATQLKESQLNLVVAGTEHAVLMVESEAHELAEDVMLGSVVFGPEQMKAAIQAIHELAEGREARLGLEGRREGPDPGEPHQGARGKPVTRGFCIAPEAGTFRDDRRDLEARLRRGRRGQGR